jgi:HEAT repeat protein
MHKKYLTEEQVETLGKECPVELLKILLERDSYDPASVAFAGLYAAESVSAGELWPVALTLAADPAPRIREIAVRILSIYETPQAQSVLQQLVEDDQDETVRRYAYAAL